MAQCQARLFSAMLWLEINAKKKKKKNGLQGKKLVQVTNSNRSWSEINGVTTTVIYYRQVIPKCRDTSCIKIIWYWYVIFYEKY